MNRLYDINEKVIIYILFNIYKYTLRLLNQSKHLYVYIYLYMHIILT